MMTIRMMRTLVRMMRMPTLKMRVDEDEDVDMRRSLPHSCLHTYTRLALSISLSLSLSLRTRIRNPLSSPVPPASLFQPLSPVLPILRVSVGAPDPALSLASPLVPPPLCSASLRRCSASLRRSFGAVCAPKFRLLRAHPPGIEPDAPVF